MVNEAAPDKPLFVQRNDPLWFVVEGIGDVVEKYYEPAFRALQNTLQGRRDIHVTFADKSEFWRHDPYLVAKMRRVIASVQSWGADYLDKSDPAELVRYEHLPADMVIIATPDFTHVEVAEAWLRRQPRPEQIFIEKPLAASLDDARQLLGRIASYDKGVLAFDHYRARFHPTRTQLRVLLDFLGKGLRRFTFYFLEDHSGADPNYPDAVSVKRDGPIENEQRVKTVMHGMILDGMPHVIALLAHFGRVETLRVTRVQAGQYVGVDGDPKKRTEIAKETFANVEFVCADYAGNPVEGTAYVGKGVRGVRALGSAYDYNVKLLEVEGLNGNIARFDLRSSGPGSGKASLIDETGIVQLEFPLYAKPYYTFLEKILDGTYLADGIGLYVEVGKRILEVLEDMRYPIGAKDDIPTYPCGMTNGRDSLYLEEIVDHLPILYGFK